MNSRETIELLNQIRVAVENQSPAQVSHAKAVPVMKLSSKWIFRKFLL